MYSQSGKKMQFAFTIQVLRFIQSILGYLFGFMFSTRAKKLLWLGIFVALTIIYYGSSRFILPHRHLKVVHGGHKDAPLCLQNSLEKWYEKMEKADAVIKHIPSDSVDHEFLPFVGDGFIGMTIDGDKNALFILNDTVTGPIQIPFTNLVQFSPMGETQDHDETIVLDMKSGEIHRFTTFNGDDARYCIVVEQIISIHRQIPGLLYQEIKINNYRPSPVHGVFDLEISKNWQKEVIDANGRKSDAFALTHGIVEGKNGDKKIIALASSLFSKEEKLTGNKPVRLQLCTLIRTEDLAQQSNKQLSEAESKKIVDEKLSILKKRLTTEWSSLLRKSLRKSHILAWDAVWELSISIDSMDDPHTPSPLNVNITEYYLYSTTVLNNATSASVLESRTYKCFHGAPTMHSPHYWVLPKNIGSLLALRKIWNNTLMNFGCGKLLESGLYGLQRAVVLSFPGLQYARHHLELAVNPISLSSNVSLRRFPFNENIIYIRISINPPHGIKTVEIFTVNQRGPKLYACGSACEHVVEVGSSPSIFLAKITNPVTPILYVSRNRSDLQVIKASPFMMEAVKEIQVDDEPRFAAHHFKLSAKFWLAVVLVIIVFHVVVFKMIYAECRQEKTKRRGRGRPFVS